MAVAFGAAGTLGAAASGTSIAPALPSFSVGNLLFGVVATKNNATHSWPAGWTKVAQVNSGASWTVSFAWRIAQSGDTAPSVSWTGSVANTGQIWTYTGQDQFGPIGIVGAVGSGTVSPHTSSSLTTSRANSLVIYLDACSTNTALTTPSTFTSHVSSTSATSVTAINSGDKTVANQNTASGAISTTGGAAAWVQWQIEILAPYPPDPDQQVAGELSDPHLLLLNPPDRVDRFWGFNFIGSPWHVFVPPDTTKLFRPIWRSLPDQPAIPLLQQSPFPNLVINFAPVFPAGIYPGNPVYEVTFAGKFQPDQIQLHSWTWSYNLNLIGQDQLPAGNFPGNPVFELTPASKMPVDPYRSFVAGTALAILRNLFPPGNFPGNPIFELTWTAKFPIDQPALRTWTWSYNLNLIGKDQLPVGDQSTALAPSQIPPEQIQLHSWQAFYNLNLIGQDKLPAGEQFSERPQLPVPPHALTWTWFRYTLIAKPFAQYDWPVPNAPEYHVQLRHWFAPIPSEEQLEVPFAQYDWPNPKTPYYGIDLTSYTRGYLLNLIGQDQLPAGEQSTALTPSQVPPDQIQIRSWQWFYNLNLIGRDRFPAGARLFELPPVGPEYHVQLRFWSMPTPSEEQIEVPLSLFNKYDWPNPTQPYRIDQTWTWSYNKNLIGQDHMVTGEQLTELPPRAPPRAQDLLTWIQSVNLALVTAPPIIPIAQRDWPVPIAPQQPAQSFTASYNPNLIGKDQLPIRQQEWPLPQTPQQAAQSWIDQTKIALAPSIPFSQDDWPLPIQPARLDQTWTASYNKNLIGQDELPFRQQDWPNPTRVVERAGDWIAATRLVLFVQGFPFHQTDWSLPIAPAPLVQSWTASYNLNLIGQDRLPNRQQDWPLTPAAQRAADLATWIDRVKFLLLTPFAQLDWPLPIAPQQPAQSYAASYNLNLIGKDRLPVRQPDWPLPAAHTTPTLLQTWSEQTAIWLIPPVGPLPPGVMPGNLLYARPIDPARGEPDLFTLTKNSQLPPPPTGHANTEWLVRARRRGLRQGLARG